MAEILEILAGRRQQTQKTARGQQLISATVIRVDDFRPVVSDGFHSFNCESLLSEVLRTGDRVWVARGAGVSLVIGLQGRAEEIL